MSGRMVLHVGLQKTATTHIQKSLEKIRVPMRAEGVLYPRFFNEYGNGHHNLGRCLRGNDLTFRRRRSFSGLSHERRLELLASSRADTVLLSSETLFGLSIGAMRRLAEAGAGRDVVAVIFLRRRSDLMLSKWRSEVKWNPRPPLEEYVRSSVGKGWKVPAFLPSLRRLETAFGNDAVRIVDYDGMVAAGVDPVSALFRAGGLELDGSLPLPAPVGRVNASDPVVEAELMRLVQLHRDDVGTGDRAEDLSRGLRALRGKAVYRRAVDLLEETRPQHETLAWVDDEHRGENSAILEQFGTSALFVSDSGCLRDTAAHEYEPVPFFEAGLDDESLSAAVVALDAVLTKRRRRR